MTNPNEIPDEFLKVIGDQMGKRLTECDVPVKIWLKIPPERRMNFYAGKSCMIVWRRPGRYGLKLTEARVCAAAFEPKNWKPI
jgi:hypothetical protein